MQRSLPDLRLVHPYSAVMTHDYRATDARSHSIDGGGLFAEERAQKARTHRTSLNYEPANETGAPVPPMSHRFLINAGPG